MEIDEANPHVGGHGGEHTIGRTPGAVDRLHKQLTKEATHANPGAIAGRHDAPFAAVGFAGIVGGADHVVGRVERGEDFLAAENVIAEGDAIDARGFKLFVNLRSDAGTRGGILGVGDHEVELVRLDKLGNAGDDDFAPGATHDVANEEESHDD